MRAALLAIGALCLAAWVAPSASAVIVTYSPSMTVLSGPIAVTAGQPFTVWLESMGPCPQTATVDWGNGQSSPITLVRRDYWECDLYGSGTLSRPGPLTVHITATWSDPNYFTGPWDVPMVVEPWSFTAHARKGVAGAELDWPVAQFTYTAGSGPYTATADFGDGQSGPVTVSNGGVYAKHTYAHPGSYPVTIDLSDGGVPDGEVTTRAVIADCGPVTPAGDAFIPPVADANARWLAALYHDVLGRVPDAAAQSTFIHQIATGTTREQIAAAVVDSPEASADALKATYQALLGRPPSQDELAAGGSVAQVLTSDEYYDLSHAEANGPELADLVRAASCDMLGRPATDAEIATVQNSLDRAGAINSILGSAGYRAHAVDVAYERYLRRAPTAAERQAVAGRSQNDLAVALLASPEYFQRANGGGAIVDPSIARDARIRLVLRRASLLRLAVIRGGTRLGTAALGRHARGQVDLHWNRDLHGHALRPGTYSVVLEAWSYGRLIDATDPVPLRIA
jgi:hypothetical protein